MDLALRCQVQNQETPLIQIKRLGGKRKSQELYFLYSSFYHCKNSAGGKVEITAWTEQHYQGNLVTSGQDS